MEQAREAPKKLNVLAQLRLKSPSVAQHALAGVGAGGTPISASWVTLRFSIRDVRAEGDELRASLRAQRSNPWHGKAKAGLLRR